MSMLGGKPDGGRHDGRKNARLAELAFAILWGVLGWF